MHTIQLIGTHGEMKHSRGQAFYVGTYFPASSRQGMPGFATILLKLADAYKTKKDQVLSSTEEFMQALKETSMDITAQEAERLEKSMLEEAAVTLLHLGDPIHGGFGQAPKFPNASNLLFLLRAHELSGISKYKNFVIFTADKMAAGGIYDHIGGGFARYSTDQRWLTPHFEKGKSVILLILTSLSHSACILEYPKEETSRGKIF